MDDKNKDKDVADTAKGRARSTLGGAVAGAVAGTALGVPVAGAVIGALSGAAIGAARKRTTGTKRKAKSASSPPKKKTSGTKKTIHKSMPGQRIVPCRFLSCPMVRFGVSTHRVQVIARMQHIVQFEKRATLKVYIRV